MSTSHITTDQYRQAARKSIQNPVLQSALAALQARIGKGAAAAYQALPEGPGLRQQAHDIRMKSIAHLDVLLETLVDRVRKNGGKVYFADTGDDAVEYCLKVARKHDVKRVVKGKSMVTEEIGLNDALEAAGIETVETDLGEYIIQLAHEKPSHIIAPAIHKTRKDIGELFARKLGIPYTDDPPTLTQAARKALRQKFLSAGMGTSGCNLACAETGHIATLSNEGNIRMSTTLPKVHVSFMGMERVTARLADHDMLFRLLSRGAAVQTMATYVNYVGGPRQPDQVDGPDEFHLVILDNGRSKILADPELREILGCIRCAACLNVCPVYAKIGGHAYGFAYSGPVGTVITPLLTGINQAKDLCLGETLCGACKEICPVDIDLPRMILTLRAKLADGDPGWNVTPVSRMEKGGMVAWSKMIQSRKRYDQSLKLARLGQKLLPGKDGMIRRLPPPFSGWTIGRDLKQIAGESFNEWWRKKG